MQALQLVTYISILIAAVAIIAKVLRYASTPEHFRWELYPVPHEKGRADYGGSFLEELDWWSKPRESDTFNELKEMAAEVLLLKGVYHHNKKVWIFSQPFHFGMYLCIGWLFMLLIGSIFEIAGVAVAADAGIVGKTTHYLTVVCGYAGLVLTGIGALGLFFWRLADSDQRGYNSPAEYINLIVIDLVVAVALISHITIDPSFSFLRGYVQSLATFSAFTSPGAWFTYEAILVSLLIMYIPLTRMSHFVAKYFLYHAVRWNDEPNMRGSKIEKSLLKLLDQNVGWSAPHIQTGKPWKEVAKEMNNE
ncbi:MAG: hypothetical protein ABIK83_01285 [Candidatus Zixiibacteriota bacterium]